MREQWRKFLQDNENNWAYGIVPNLVRRLADAIDVNDYVEISYLLDSLYYQGVMLDDDDNLCFVADYIYLFRVDDNCDKT
jgi:hypothetical protein